MTDQQILRAGLMFKAWLPNTVGFEFVGVRADLTEVPCQVVMGPHGHTISGAPYADIVGWKNMGLTRPKGGAKHGR